MQVFLASSNRGRSQVLAEDAEDAEDVRKCLEISILGVITKFGKVMSIDPNTIGDNGHGQ